MSQGLNMISWRDYEGADGFGQTTVQDLTELRKALSAGNDINAPAFNPGEGFALRVESLEQTLKNTTYRMEHPRLWKAIPKMAAFNTVEEYNQITDYGQLDQGAWIQEGELPVETDATYVRNYVTIKFLGTLRKVTHVMSLVKPAHGNVIAQETIAGTMYLLRQIEQNLFTGDSALDAVQWDSVDVQIEAGAPAANIIDLRGEPLSEDVLTDAALTIQDAPNFGVPTHLYLNPKVKADLVKTFFPKARYDLMEKRDGLVGLDIRGFTSPAGDVMLEPDVFVNVTPSLPAGAVGGAGAPAAPTVSTALAAAPTGGSLFTADDAGTYQYQVVAVNRFGQSAPVDATSVAVAAGDGVTLGVTPAAAGVTYYKLFRSVAGGAAGTEKLIARIPNGAGIGEETLTDLNETLPNTSNAYLFQMDRDNMSFKQLAPMVKVPLATIDTSIRWMQLIYGAPVIYTPGRNVIFRNVGRAQNFVGSV